MQHPQLSKTADDNSPKAYMLPCSPRELDSRKAAANAGPVWFLCVLCPSLGHLQQDLTCGQPTAVAIIYCLGGLGELPDQQI